MTVAWGITDGKAGNVAQVKALAHAIDAELTLHTITVNPAWKLLPNMAFDLGLTKYGPVTEWKLPPGTPDVIISCGRKGALVSASLETNIKRIHIQDPKMSRKHFDLILAMAHDAIHGDNVIRTPYALHMITPETLVKARTHWEPKFAHLPRPWNVVLIGGSTNKYTLDDHAMLKLIEDIADIEGSLLITTSRRTGEANVRKLIAAFGGSRRAFLYTGEVENPYMGMLACADHIYVTNDSVNMMSEALATNMPVTILPLQGHARTKPALFAEGVKNLTVTPWEMMKNVADSVRQMLAKGA